MCWLCILDYFKNLSHATAARRESNWGNERAKKGRFDKQVQLWSIELGVALGAKSGTFRSKKEAHCMRTFSV